jgi:hypothetical protein
VGVEAPPEALTHVEVADPVVVPAVEVERGGQRRHLGAGRGEAVEHFPPQALPLHPPGTTGPVVLARAALEKERAKPRARTDVQGRREALLVLKQRTSTYF